MRLPGFIATAARYGMAFNLEFTARFRKAYRKKTSNQQSQIDNTLQLLATNPRHNSLETHKVQGAPGIWECYINEGWRITFEYADDCVLRLRNNCTHDEMLRKKKRSYF